MHFMSTKSSLNYLSKKHLVVQELELKTRKDKFNCKTVNSVTSIDEFSLVLQNLTRKLILALTDCLKIRHKVLKPISSNAPNEQRYSQFHDSSC